MNDRRAIAVLAYHKIGPPSEPGWDTHHHVPTDIFRSQLERLVEAGPPVISAGQFLAGLLRPRLLPARSVLLTFDDASRSVLTEALPVLCRLGLPAVCFVPVDHVGGTNVWDRGVEPRDVLCDWDDLRVLQRQGVSVQSHGRSHRWLSCMDAAERERELHLSRRVLERQLGRRVELFAYPYSDACQDAGWMDAEVERAGYRAAFLCSGTPPWNTLPPRAPCRLGRVAVDRSTDLALELRSNALGG